MTDREAPSGVVLDAENPWPGLHEFDERGRDFFNGRDQETADLLRLVRDAPLTVLFGGSGLGKTSLLQAGLLPSLRKEQYLPVYVRLVPLDRRTALIEQAAIAFRTQLLSQAVDHPAFAPGESLWEYLHRADLELWSKHNRLLTPVFVFDQFEEVFTLGAENAEAVQALREDLADLIENRVPGVLARRLEQAEAPAPPIELQARRFKLLLSFREDFLPEAEGWRSAIPAIMRNRLRLLPMNDEQAFEAVSKTGGRLVDEPIAREIVRFAAAARTELKSRDLAAGAPVGEWAQPPQPDVMEHHAIEPALLSLVCTGLNERRKTDDKKRIDHDLLRGTGRAIVTEFYEGCVRDLPSRVRRFIENELITENGYRNPYPREDAISQGFVTETELEDLVKRRLLRVEPHLGTDRIELIHDLLTAAVREFRDRERLREKRELELRKDRKQRRHLMAAGVLVLVALGLAGTFWQLWITANEASIRINEAKIKAENALQAYEAEKERRESAEVKVERNKALETADADRKLALSLASNKNYDGALELLTKSLAGYKGLGEEQKVAIALIDIGKMHVLKREYGPAKKNYDQAHGIATDSANEALEGLVFESLAALGEQEGNTKEAMKLYSQSHEKYVVAGELIAAARVLERLAAHSEEGRDYDSATDLYRKTLDSYIVAGDSMGVARVENALRRTVPWGFLVNLKTAERYQVLGSRVTIGRSTSECGITTDIGFSSRYVSRLHLAINRDDYQVVDFRSTNGTTVNATQLPYGACRNLSEGDIITVGNQEALQFRTAKSKAHPPPLLAWGIFINGKKKNYQYLTGTEYSLTMHGGKLAIEPGFSQTALMRLRHVDKKVEMYVVEDDWSLIVTQKESDYEYKMYPLPSGKWIDALNTPSMYARLSPDGKRIIEEGPSFQLVPIKGSE